MHAFVQHHQPAQESAWGQVSPHHVGAPAARHRKRTQGALCQALVRLRNFP